MTYKNEIARYSVTLLPNKINSKLWYTLNTKQIAD